MSKWFVTFGLAVCAAVLWAPGAGVAAAAQAKPKVGAAAAKPPKTQPAKPKAAKAADKPGTGPVTRAEAEALAKRIGAAAAKGDYSALSAAIDEAEFFNRAVAGLNLPPAMRAGIARGMRIGTALPETIRTQTAAEGGYRFLRVLAPATPGAAPRPLFRLSSPLGFNYHELQLYRDDTGAVRVADMYVFLTGELMSQTVRGMMLSALPKDGSVKLTKEMADIADSAGDLTQLRQHLGAGRHAEAMALFEKFPEGLKALKSVALIRVMITAGLGEDQYAAALEDYRQRFPGGAEIDLVSIDALFLKQDFEGVLAAVGRLDKQVGGDPFLDQIRANVAFSTGDAEKGRALLRKVMKAEPTMPDAYRLLAQHEAVAQNYAEVVSVLTAGERDAGVQWGDLKQVPEFAGFVSSAEYAKWKASRPAPAPEGDGLE